MFEGVVPQSVQCFKEYHGQNSNVSQDRVGTAMSERIGL